MIIWNRVRPLTIALALGASFVAVPTWAQPGGATAPAGAVQSAGIRAQQQRRSTVEQVRPGG